jgi:opacity protein-like surface antigen
MYELPDDYIYTVDKKPTTYREVFSLGGRYYLRIKKINPYLQIGISEEFNLLNSFNITGVSTSQAYDSSFGHFKDIAYYKLSIFAGAGVNFKINNKVAIDIQYDVYLNIEKNDGNFIAHSVLVGLKYIL